MGITRSVHFRMYLNDYKKLLKAAKNENMPVGTYVRRVIEGHLK